MATKPADSSLSVGERAAIGRIEKALFGSDASLVEIGRYSIDHLIGSGSFGKVYRAHDPQLERDVAVKLVPATATSDRDELMREARVMATIRHPNVCAIHDAGIVDEGVFLAMELVTGASLRDWLKASHPRTEIVGVLVQAGRGLAAAHAAGIVHRDFKPDNVLVDGDGRAQVIDFGLARTHDDDARVAGTPAYMAPELLDQTDRLRVDALAATVAHTAGSAPPRPGERAATAASDQFAFAVTAAEAVLGKRPFAATTLDDQLAAFDRRPDLPRDRLRAVLQRALARAPADRFGSVSELVDAIEHVEARRPRVWLAAGLVGAAIGAAIIATVATRHSEITDPCPSPSDELAGVWDPTVRTQMASAMHGLPRGDQIYARIATILDRDTHAWLDARLQACAATAIRHEQSPQLLDLRVACLRGWKRQLAAVTKSLLQPTSQSLALAPRSLGELPALARCSDADALTAEASEIDPVAEQALADARTALSGGRTVEAIGKVRAVIGDAKADQGPLAIAAPLLEADALVAAARYDEARTAARRAFDAAIAALDKRSAARAASVIAFVGAYDPSHAAEALQWVASGTKLTATLDDAIELDARLANAEGNVELAAGAAPAAATALRRAVAGFTRLDPDHWALGASLAALGAAEQDLGDLDAAERDLRAGVDRIERDFGADHVDVATGSINLALVLAARGHYVDARAAFDRAIVILARVGGPDDARLAYAYLDRSQVDWASGDLAGARRDLEDAQRIALESPSFGETHPFTAQIAMARAAVLADARDVRAITPATLAFERLAKTDRLTAALAEATYARALATSGKRTEALGHARTAGETADAMPAGPGAIRGLIYQAYGDLALEANDLATATVQLQAALSAFSSGATDPMRISMIRFALARATNDAAPARQALASFPRDGDPARRTAIERWLASH